MMRNGRGLNVEYELSMPNPIVEMVYYFLVYISMPAALIFGQLKLRINP